jgi:hypothetical protein
MNTMYMKPTESRGSGSFTLIALILFFVMTASSAFAELATVKESEQVCRNWLTYVVEQTGNWDGDANPQIASVQELKVNDTILARYYAISSGGYVLVPALRDLPPIKAYSQVSTFDVNDADGVALMFRQILQQRMELFAEVYGSVEAPQPKSGQRLFGIINKQRWDMLSVPSEQFDATVNKAAMEPADGVGPLLSTAWDQFYPYNMYCPTGDGGQCVVGCVATAMAQIMWYHQWPPAGQGSHSYYWPGDRSCGGSSPGQTVSADYSDPYVYQETPENVAELSYEVGVAFDMDYGVCGSGAYLNPALTVLAGNFFYDNTVIAKYHVQYGDTQWFNMIVNQINQGLPILYFIYSHSIVCDGWRTYLGLSQYHFNYGWADGHTAWYTLDNLYCPWDGCGINNEAMVMNIIPLNGSPWLGSNELSDATYGNGDGIPEAGETVEMYFTIANYGGADINNVNVNLLVDDQSLTVTDGQSYLGAIPARDSVDNSGDPMAIQIPADYVPRIDSLFLVVTWNDGAGIDTIAVEKAIGKIPILIVDDDNADTLESIYAHDLQSLRIPYDIWQYSAYSPPDSATMSKYDLVIWFTGDYRPAPLSTDEIDALRTYLDAGGNLFLTGQAIAPELNSTDSTFLADYLKATYQSTVWVPVLETQAGSQVFDTIASLSIQGAGGASNQTNPDLIQPINGSTPELLYLGQSDYGGVSYVGNYRLIFFSFGYEGIMINNSRWLDRRRMLANILDFFQCQKPNGCPVASDLNVNDDDPVHLMNHVPTFYWSYSDGESSPQAMYQFQMGTDNDWTVAEMWDPGPTAGVDTQLTYAGPELLDGNRYYMRVRVNDGSLWSAWTESNIRMNSAPGAPVAAAPIAMQGMTSLYPQLTVDNAVDAENDALTYDFEIYSDADLTNLVASVSGQTQGYPQTSWTDNVSLVDDQAYFWRARASDLYETGAWSDTASFWVNSPNTPPTAVDLMEPADGAGLPYLQPTFTWTAANDADPYDQINYTLYYSTDSTFASTNTVSNIDTTRYFLQTQLPYATTYFWRVRSNDLFGGHTLSTQVYSFTTLLRGDANGDGAINVADAVFLITYIFKGGAAPNPLDAGDADCDQNVNLSDAVHIINFVFKGGPEPGCI